jgi:hypothetical protein
MQIVLGWNDMFIASPVLDEQEKQVVQSSHGLEFRRSIQFKLDLQRAVDVLRAKDEYAIEEQCRKRVIYLDNLV